MTSPDAFPLTPIELAARIRARSEIAARKQALHKARLAQIEADAYAQINSHRISEIDESPMNSI